MRANLAPCEGGDRTLSTEVLHEPDNGATGQEVGGLQAVGADELALAGGDEHAPLRDNGQVLFRVGMVLDECPGVVQLVGGVEAEEFDALEVAFRDTGEGARRRQLQQTGDAER